MTRYERLERLRLKYERKKMKWDRLIDLIDEELEEMRLKDTVKRSGKCV